MEALSWFVASSTGVAVGFTERSVAVIKGALRSSWGHIIATTKSIIHVTQTAFLAVEARGKAQTGADAAPGNDGNGARHAVAVAAPPPAAPLPGYLVADSAAPPGFGGEWPDKYSTDGSDSDEDIVADLSSCSFSHTGGKHVRDSSFRKRDAAKLERAKHMRAQSSVLTSHLVTPAQHNRSVQQYADEGIPCPGTVGSRPRRLSDTAEKQGASTSKLNLVIPPHPSSLKAAAHADPMSEATGLWNAKERSSKDASGSGSYKRRKSKTPSLGLEKIAASPRATTGS